MSFRPWQFTFTTEDEGAVTPSSSKTSSLRSNDILVMASTYQRLDFIAINPQTGRRGGRDRELQLSTIRSHAGSIRTSKRPRNETRFHNHHAKALKNLVRDEESARDGTPGTNHASPMLHDPFWDTRDPFNILANLGLPDYTVQILDHAARTYRPNPLHGPRT